MKKSLLPLLAGLVMASPAIGRQLTPQEALASAGVSQPGTSGARRIAAQQPRLTHTFTKDGLNTIYVFNRPTGGWLLLSADDAAVSVLAYSDSGTFDTTSMPSNVTAWLDFYSGEIAEASKAGVIADPDAMTLSTVTKSDIAPMVTTHWNQDAPFNDQCPMIGNQRTVTGCVATALAQVMNYHRWPAKGYGTVSYEWRNQTLSMNLGATTFDWDNMLNDYTSTATAAQNTAVATLMKACGYASQMDYALASSGGSAASYLYSASSLVDNLYYDKGVRFLQRDYYTLGEWTDLVYGELAAGRPVPYSGSSATGAGHAFVFDGYSQGDFFHVNWGWGGMSDGYFKLTALDPESQGIGGGGAGYNINQDILAGLQPAKAGSELAVVIRFDGSFGTDATSYTFNDSYVTFTSPDNGGIWNFSAGPVSFIPAIKLVDEKGEASYIQAAKLVAMDYKPLQGRSSYQVTRSELPQGTYTVTPAAKVGDKWIDVPTKINASVRALKMTNSGVRTNFEKITAEASLTATDITSSNPVYNGYPCKITANIANTGTAEYLGNVVAVLINSSGSLAANSSPVMMDIPAGETMPFEAITTFISNSAIAAGTYRLALVSVDSNMSLTGILGYCDTDITVKSAPTESTLSTTTMKAQGKLMSAYLTATVPSTTTFSYTLKCDKGFVSGLVGGVIFYDDTTEEREIGHTFVSLSEGESADVEMQADMSTLEEDHTYFVVAWDITANKQIGNAYRFRIDKSLSGVTTVVVEGEVVKTEVYDLNGRLVANGLDTMLPAGVYVVRSTMADGSVVTDKIAR